MLLPAPTAAVNGAAATAAVTATATAAATATPNKRRYALKISDNGQNCPNGNRAVKQNKIHTLRKKFVVIFSDVLY